MASSRKHTIIMESPLKYIEDQFPIEIINHIQSYMRNDVMYRALQEYFDYLHYKENLYNNFVSIHYVKPNCYCSRSIREDDVECNHCMDYEYNTKYVPNDFHICIDENDQYRKIVLHETCENIDI